jgi:hypothetical protein
VIIDTPEGEVIGQAGRLDGRKTTLKNYSGNFSGQALRVRVVGREDLTLAERGRAELILLASRQERLLRDSSFIRLFCFPGPNETRIIRKIEPSTQRAPQRDKLNSSQSRVVDAMVTDVVPLVVVQGTLSGIV